MSEGAIVRAILLFNIIWNVNIVIERSIHAIVAFFRLSLNIYLQK